MIKAGKRPRVIYNPGTPGVGHQWAYLPDVAETMMRLIELPNDAAFATYHMGGFWDESGTGMTTTISSVLGEPSIGVKALPWWLMRFAGLFSVTSRELLEMYYLWKVPIQLDNTKLKAVLGSEMLTPLHVAVEVTLQSVIV